MYRVKRKIAREQKNNTLIPKDKKLLIFALRSTIVTGTGKITIISTTNATHQRDRYQRHIINPLVVPSQFTWTY